MLGIQICPNSYSSSKLSSSAVLLAKAWRFDVGPVRVQVIAQLTGEKRLPWEMQGVAAAERLESLGVFKGAVLQLLNRDPTLRPSMQRFYDAANRIFSARTTIKS